MKYEKVKRVWYATKLSGAMATISNAQLNVLKTNWKKEPKEEEEKKNLNLEKCINGIGIWYKYDEDSYYFSDESK